MGDEGAGVVAVVAGVVIVDVGVAIVAAGVVIVDVGVAIVAAGVVIVDVGVAIVAAGVVIVDVGVAIVAGLVVVVATSGLGSTEDEIAIGETTAEPSAAATELAAATTTGFSLFANGFTICRDS